MKKIFLFLAYAALSLVVGACKKPAEQPPVTKISDGYIYTMDYLKVIATCTNNCPKRFTEDVYVIGVVVADEVSGNFYKEVFLRDRNGKAAMHLDLLYGNSGFFIGDSLRVMLKGYDIAMVDGILTVDSLNFEKSVVKFGSGANPQPKVVNLSQLGPNDPYSNYLGDLITINDVSFIPADTNKIWADAINQSSLNRTIQDCDGNSIVVRTSNYASFWNQKTPKGFGTITGIATAYGTTNQLVIRRPSEANMNGTGCTIYLKKDFNDQSLTTGQWGQASVTNSAVAWTASNFGGEYFAKASGYVGGSNTNSETWLISPSINLSAATNPVLSFRTAAKFSGTALEVVISTNYVSGAPGTGAWTPLTGYALSPNTGNYVWTPSGIVSLNAYKSAGVRIAFKYKSTTTGATTYEVDDIIIKEN